MYLYVTLLLVTARLFGGTDCRRHIRHRLVRQDQQIYRGSVEDANIYAGQSVSQQMPFSPNAYLPNPDSAAATPPPLPPPPPPPPDIIAQPSDLQSSSSFPALYITSTSFPFGSFMAPTPNYAPGIIMPVSTDANPPYQPTAFSYKRRRKNASRKNRVGKLLETIEKNLLEQSTLDGILGGNGSLEGGDFVKNVTAIPIPKGVQLKSVSKTGDTQIDEIVNITSSTQKSISFGNSTEIENVVEMQMQKKIEDEKGANKGLEEVRIVETERVKPLPKNWKNLTFRNKRKNFRSRRFKVLHRSIRSSMDSEGMTRPNPVFNKMAKQFFSRINRKERVVKENGFSNHEDTTNVGVSNRVGMTRPDPVFHKMAKQFFSRINRKERVVKENGVSNHDDTTNVGVNNRRDALKNTYHDETNKKDELSYHRNIINDFMKFFSMEMKKFQKIQESGKTSIRSIKHLNGSRHFHDSKFSKYRIKKAHKLNYPEHMKIVLNTNMTWEAKITAPRNEPRRRTVEQESSPSAPATPYVLLREVSTKEPVTERLLLKGINDEDSMVFFGMLCLAAVVFSVGTLICIVPRLLKIVRVTSDSSVKAYRLYQKGKTLGPNSHGNGKECIDYPHLEWQSENGDWLSEQETDFR